MKRYPKLQVTLIVVAMICTSITFAVRAQARIIYVPSIEAVTIQQGIDTAMVDDTVMVACGAYYEYNINMKSGVQLMSETGTAECCTIDAQRMGRVFICESVDSTTSIRGFTITGGLAEGPEGDAAGAGFYLVYSSPLIENCLITDNKAKGVATWPDVAIVQGGGMYCFQSSPTLKSCVFFRNIARSVEPLPGQRVKGGGMYCYESSPTLIDCEFLRNIGKATVYIYDPARLYGGGLFCSHSSGMLINCIFSADSIGMNGEGKGGAIYLTQSSLTVSACSLSKNWAMDAGGGMALISSPSTIDNCTIFRNVSWGSAGGGIYCDRDSGTAFTGCTISENSATIGGGGMWFHNSSPTLNGCTISKNYIGNFDGGGIWCDSSSPIIENCIISENHAIVSGGGITCRDYSFPVISGCTISENVATGMSVSPWLPGNGGGISCFNSCPVISECIISGNRAGSGDREGYGGGIYSSSDSPEIEKCVITGNKANSNGGGIYWSSSSSPIIQRCTVSGNVADTGGGLFGIGSARRPEKTIIWDNCAESGVGDEWYGAGGPFVKCCNAVDSIGLDGFDPDFTILCVNGPNVYDDPWFCCPVPCDSAPTAEGDYTLCPSSSCAPEYSPGDCGLIGALGIGSCPYRGDVNDDGYIGMADVVYLVNYLFRGGPPPDPLWMGDVNCDGIVDIADVNYLMNYLYGGGRPPCCYCDQ